MSDTKDPPPIFDNVDIFEKDDGDDLFASAIDHVETLSVENRTHDDGSNTTGNLSEHLKHQLNLDAEILKGTDNKTDGGYNILGNLTELPKLQLSMAKELPPPTPVDENEPEVIQSPVPAQRKHPTPTIGEQEDQFLEVSVTEGTRIGDGMGAYVAYRVQTTTNIKLYKKKLFSVQRRFSDFLGLHEKLVEKYLRTGHIIPPAPEKSVIGMTKVKMSGGGGQVTEPSGASTDFVVRRRAALERYLARTASHPLLSLDPDFRDFLELDVELPKATNTSALSGAGVMRLFNKVGETVNKITYKMEETDRWFRENTAQIESLDSNLRRLHASVEMLVLGRKELAGLTSAFAKSAAMLSNCEEHTALSRALSQLAEVEEKVEMIHNEQANADFSIFCELLKDYVALIGAIKEVLYERVKVYQNWQHSLLVLKVKREHKEVLHERVKVYQNWQHSQLVLNKKREQKAKLDLSNRVDKGSATGTEISEWEAKAERCEEEFSKISKMIKKEMNLFESARVKDFKAYIIKYLEEQMNLQHQWCVKDTITNLQLVKCWETFLPEAKAIA